MGDENDDLSYTKQPVQEFRPASADDVPDEEDVSSANIDTADVDTDPEDRLSRPDQPGFDPAEREQFQNPPVDHGLDSAENPADDPTRR